MDVSATTMHVLSGLGLGLIACVAIYMASCSIRKFRALGSFWWLGALGASSYGAFIINELTLIFVVYGTIIGILIFLAHALTSDDCASR